MKPYKLTAQEKKILELVAEGLTNDEIASQLMCSRRTVETHIANMSDKLHERNRTRVIIKAMQHGILDLISLKCAQ